MSRLERLFDGVLLQRAEQIVRQHGIVLECDERGGWLGSGVEQPTVFGGGQPPDERMEDTRPALYPAVAHLLELGQHPPKGVVRTLQVNIRLTPEEKLVLSSTARQIGFQGLSGHARSAVMDRAGRTRWTPRRFLQDRHNPIDAPSLGAIIRPRTEETPDPCKGFAACPQYRVPGVCC